MSITVCVQYDVSNLRVPSLSHLCMAHTLALFSLPSEMVIFNGPIVRSIALSPDGKLIISCSDDTKIHVWNATMGGTAAGPFTGHTDEVASVAFSPDGQHIILGSKDQTIRVWNAMTGETATGCTARLYISSTSCSRTGTHPGGIGTHASRASQK